MSYLTLRARLLFLFVFLFDWHRDSGACGFIRNYAMLIQLGLWDPGMCIPIMGYVVAISFNCIFDF